MTQKERRGTERVASRLPLILEEGEEECLVETSNISASGAYGLSKRFLAPMTKVQIRLEIPGTPRAATIDCQGVVVRVEPRRADPAHPHYMMAIMFSGLPDHDRSTIARYVQRRLQGP